MKYTERGIDVVMATGRPSRWLPPVIEATGLTSPVIVANGAIIVDTQSLEPLEIRAITPNQATEAVGRITAALPRRRGLGGARALGSAPRALAGTGPAGRD